MHISRLSLTNFGPFRQLNVGFPPFGVSVISGPNGSGKSQLLGAAVAAVMGKRAVSVDPLGRGPSRVELALARRDESGEEVVSLRVAAANTGRIEKKVEVVHTSSSWLQALVESVDRDRAPRFLIGESAKVKRLRHQELDDFEGLAPKELLRGSFWQDIRRSRYLETGVYSAGVSVVIEVIREFISRANGDCFPCLVDGVFGQLDARASEFCAELFRVIGQKSQVIVVMPSYAELPLGREAIRLPQQESPLRAIAHYIRPTRPTSPRSRLPSACGRRQFKIGERFPMRETRLCELKEVKGNNPVGSITQVVDQYVVAFLNAGIEQTGSIFWGVTDDSRTVVGVRLTDSQCDEVRRIVVEKVGNIVPPIALTAVSIEFHPVASSGSAIPLYVVEVRVPAVQGAYLYATGSDDVYIKTDAGKKKLRIMQIQEELLRRMKLTRTV